MNGSAWQELSEGGGGRRVEMCEDGRERPEEEVEGSGTKGERREGKRLGLYVVGVGEDCIIDRLIASETCGWGAGGAFVYQKMKGRC